MLYYLLKYTMMFTLRLFFRKVSFGNIKNYPSSGPVILAAMHPNSFIDDMTLGAFTKRELTFLARGDVFSTKLNRFLLGQMFVSPIYRAMDNAKDVKKNIEALDSYSRKLRKGKVILIHSEGICVIEKRVRKIRKGTARIAFGAEESSDFNLGLKVVPVSMNYTNAPKIRERVMVDFGEPIEMKQYEALYKENPAKATNQFNNDLHASLVSKSIHLENKETDTLANQCLEIIENDKPPKSLPILNNDTEQLAKEKAVADKINDLYANNNQKYEALEAISSKYFNSLHQHNLKDKAITPSKNIALKSILLLIVSPLFSLAYILNVLPVFLGRKVAEKVVKTDEFYGSVYVGASWLFGIIYYAILATVVAITTTYSGILSVLAIAFFGFWSVLLRDEYIKLFNHFKYNRIFKKNPELKSALQLMRSEIKSSISL